MGRGDKRTTKGKIFKHSNGNSRPKNSKIPKEKPTAK
jgi:ribosomal small subunit protein bTHX